MAFVPSPQPAASTALLGSVILFSITNRAGDSSIGRWVGPVAPASVQLRAKAAEPGCGALTVGCRAPSRGQTIRPARTGPPARSRTAGCRLLYPPAQPVQQVDPGDQAQEAVAVDDDRDMAAVEHRQQGFDRRLGVQDVELAHHRGGHRVAELRLVAI